MNMNKADWKRIGKNLLQNYLSAAVLISIIVFVLGSVYSPEACFGYEVLLYPLLLSAISMIPVLLGMFLKPSWFKELFQLVLIELLMYLSVFGFKGPANLPASLLVAFLSGVAIVYIFVCLIEWLLQNREAKKLTELVKAYQIQSKAEERLESQQSENSKDTK